MVLMTATGNSVRLDCGEASDGSVGEKVVIDMRGLLLPESSLFSRETKWGLPNVRTDWNQGHELVLPMVSTSPVRRQESGSLTSKLKAVLILEREDAAA